MTAIAIWRFDEPNTAPFIWAAADSRISGIAGPPLIDDAVKLFSLPIVCRVGHVGGLITFAYSVGYSFAGSTLMGQNAYLALVPLLTNLIVHEPQQIPSFQHVTAFVRDYLRLSFEDFVFVAGGEAMFEVAIFGFCHVRQQLRVCHLRPARNELTGTYEVVIVRDAPMEHRDILCLGDRRQEIEEEGRAGFDSPLEPGNMPGRAPRRVIERYIADQLVPTIGGRLQLGIADRFRFQGMPLVRPRLGAPEAEMTYLGRNIWEELRTVGPAIVSLPGMV